MDTLPAFTIVRESRRPRCYAATTAVMRMQRIERAEDFYDGVRRAFRFPAADAALRRGVVTLSRHECQVVVAEAYAYLADLDRLRQQIEEYAPLLAFFPGMAWDTLEKLGPDGRLFLGYEMRRLEARKKLEAIQLLSAAFNPKPPTMWYLHLAGVAYDADSQEYKDWVAAISHTRH